MEVQCKRILRKHLQPARPLRRCTHGYIEPVRIADSCGQAHTEIEEPEKNVDVEQFDKIVDSQNEKEEKIYYTREFLLSLESSPLSKRRPENLPDHPIILTKVRRCGLHYLTCDGIWREEKCDTAVAPL